MLVKRRISALRRLINAEWIRRRVSLTSRNIRSKISAGIISFCMCTKIARDIYSPSFTTSHAEREDPVDDTPLDEYDDTSVEAEISRSLQTGDVLIFDRNIYERDLSLLLFHALSKYVNGSSFDHVGVVIRDAEDEYPYIFQVDHRGKATLTPYDECVIRSSAREIVVKRLNFCTEESDRAELVAPVVQELLNTGGTTGLVNALQPLIYGALLNPTFASRVVPMGRIQSLERRIREIGNEVRKWESYKSNTGDLKTKQGRQNEFIRRKKLKGLVAEYRASKKEVLSLRKDLYKLQNPETNFEKWRAKQLKNLGPVFPSSVAVVKILSCIGVLPSDSPDPKEYFPKHFLRPERMPLQNGAEYLPDVYLRSSNKGGRSNSRRAF